MLLKQRWLRVVCRSRDEVRSLGDGQGMLVPVLFRQCNLPPLPWRYGQRWTIWSRPEEGSAKWNAIDEMLPVRGDLMPPREPPRAEIDGRERSNTGEDRQLLQVGSGPGRKGKDELYSVVVRQDLVHFLEMQTFEAVELDHVVFQTPVSGFERKDFIHALEKLSDGA